MPARLYRRSAFRLARCESRPLRSTDRSIGSRDAALKSDPSYCSRLITRETVRVIGSWASPNFLPGRFRSGPGGVQVGSPPEPSQTRFKALDKGTAKARLRLQLRIRVPPRIDG